MLLASLQACSFGSQCSNGRHPTGIGYDVAGACSDANHSVSCQGGEGFEYDDERACPTDTPLCSTRPDGQSHVCQSQDQIDCVSDLPDIPRSSLRVADLNRDGLSDLVYTNGNLLVASLGLPAGGFSSGTTLSSFPGDFRLEQLDGDDQLDLVVIGPDRVDVQFGNGDGSFRAPRSLPISAVRLLGAGDLDSDGVADLVLENELGRYQWLSSAHDFAAVEFGLESSTPIGAGFTDTIGAVVSRARDGALQLVLAEATPQVSAYTRRGDTWSLQQSFAGALLSAADFNRDGLLDLALQRGDSVELQLGVSAGRFEPGVTLPGTGLFAADLNADGKLDLELRREHGMLELLGRGDGSFVEGKRLLLFRSGDQVVMTAQGLQLLGTSPTWTLVSASCLSR